MSADDVKTAAIVSARDRDFYEQLGGIHTALADIQERLSELRKDLREDYREFNTRLNTVVETCPAHTVRLERLERLMNGHVRPPSGQTPPVRPPTGGGYPTVPSTAAVEKAAEKAAESYMEEVTDQLRVDTLTAARAAAQAAALQAMQDEAAQKQEQRDRRVKRATSWLQLVALVLGILGSGGLVVAVKFMSAAQQALLNVQQTVRPVAPAPAPKQLPAHE